MVKRLAAGLSLWSALVWIPFASAAAEGATDCPPNLRAWKTHGSAEPGGEWGAGFVEIRGDVGILRELVLIFGYGALPEEEARWFDAPAVLEPVSLHTRTVSLVGEELASLCVELTNPALEAAADQARPRCFVTADGAKVTVKTEVSMKNPDGPASATSAASRIGLAVGASDDAGDDLVCVPMEELSSTYENADPGEAEPGILDSIATIFAELERIEAPQEIGLSALPPARHVLAVLRQNDEELIPMDLPSDFYLTAVAARGPYAEALELEQMLTHKGADEEVALKLLGDECSQSAVPLLKWKLREGVEASRGRIVALTLRALLAADPETARLEAMAFLEDPIFARGALGVFALTEPSLRGELQSLDLEDRDAVVETGRRVLAFLDASGVQGP